MNRFDLRLSLIPFSLLRIANAFRQMRIGENIEIICGTTAADKAMLNDIRRILPKGCFTVISEELLQDEDPAIFTRLKKTTHINQHAKGDSPCPRSI